MKCDGLAGRKPRKKAQSRGKKSLKTVRGDGNMDAATVRRMKRRVHLLQRQTRYVSGHDPLVILCDVQSNPTSSVYSQDQVETISVSLGFGTDTLRTHTPSRSFGRGIS